MGTTVVKGEESMPVTRKELEKFKEELLSEIKALFYVKTTYPRRWLKTRDVIKLLNSCSGKLQTLRKSGKLPYIPLGGDMYYDIEDIEEMMKKNKVSKIQVNREG
ncbi:MAG: helix-turn-helix domain-containing protein [Sphingobacterium sp.]